MGQGIIRLLLMLQCYKFNLKTDNLNSQYSFFFSSYLLNENKKVQPKFLHSMTSHRVFHFKIWKKDI